MNKTYTKRGKKMEKCKNCELKEYLVVAITPDGKCKDCGKQLMPKMNQQKGKIEALKKESTKQIRRCCRVFSIRNKQQVRAIELNVEEIVEHAYTLGRKDREKEII